MAIITLPSTVRQGPEVSWGRQTYEMVSGSDLTGAEQSRIYGPPRWTIGLRSPAAMRGRDGGAWVALLLQLRAGNLLQAWDPGRPVPVGTLRGTLTLASAAAAGAQSIVVTGGSGQAGRTLEPGDWLQIGTGLGTSQLVVCAALSPLVANGSGTLTVPVESPLRSAYAAGTAVTWDRPVTWFRRRSPGGTSWTTMHRSSTEPVLAGMAWDGIEVWSA